MINFDDAPRRSRGQDLPPRPDDAPDATEEQARNLWKLLVEGSLKGHRLRVGNTLRRGGQRGSAGSNAEFEFVEGQVPVSTGSGRRRSTFDPRRYNLKIVADAMRGEKARAIALDNLRFVMDETTGKLYLPWATKEGEARSHNAIPRDLRRYAKDALYTTSGGNTGVRHFYPPGYGPLDDEDAPESRQPKAPVSELRGERGKKRLQDWWDAGGGTPGVTARLRDFSESASGGQQFRHPQQAFGIRSIPPTASAYLDRLRQWRTPGSDVEPPDMAEREERGSIVDWPDTRFPDAEILSRREIDDHLKNRAAVGHIPQSHILRAKNRLLRVPHGGLDYDPSEMSDRAPTDDEKREIVGPNVWDERMAVAWNKGLPLARTGGPLQDYEMERRDGVIPRKGDAGSPYELKRHSLRYPNYPAQQEARVNVPGSATDLRTRLLEMELNDPSVPHNKIDYPSLLGPADVLQARELQNAMINTPMSGQEERNIHRDISNKHGMSNIMAALEGAIRRNISRHRFARQPQQFGRSMGYAVDVPEQAFARETHPMLQMAIDRSLQRPHRSSMPPEIGHPRSPLEYTGAGPVVVRSAPQDLTPEAFGPGNHIVTGEMPISRRRPNFQPIREPRFNPDAAHDEVVRLMLGRLPRRRYNGKPDEPWVVRANDEWNSDPTTFQRYQQAFAVDDDPNSPRRVWQTPPVVKPQAPQKPATPSKPEGQDIQNARVLARHYARPAIQPSTPKEPGFGKPSARQGEGLSEDWIKNFVKRGDDQSNEFAPPWMRGAGYDAPWNRGRGPENIGENLFPIAPTPRMIDDRQPSLAPYRSGSRLDGGYLPRVRSVVNRAAIGGQPRSLGSVLGGAARGAWRGGTSGLGTSLGNIGLGLAGTLLGLGTQNLGTIGHGLLGIGSGALGIAGTPLRAVGGAGLGAAGYDPASWSTKRWGYKPWQVQQRQPEDDQEAPWANAPERKFSRHDHEFAAPGGAPNRVMFPSDDGSAQPGQYANAGLQTQQMRSVFGPQSSLQTTRPPFTQAAQAGGTILVTPTGGIMGVVVPPRTIPVSPTTMQPIRPQPSTRWEKPRQFARHDHEFSASGVAGQFAPNVPAMPRMNRQTFNPQPPQQEPIVDWLQALRGTGAPRPMPQQQIQRPRPKPRPSAAEEFWPRVMPFARRPQQGFSILRPYETSGGGKFPGRGIGSPYPRIVNGNVEYDPTIRPIEAGNIERNGDELRITRPQNEKRISVPVGAQIRNGITYFDPSDRIEGTPTDIQIEGAPWRPETARIYDDGGDGGEIEQLDPRRDRETDDSALRELYEWRRKARLRANQQPKSLWAGEQLPQSLDGDRVETYRKRENELSMGPEDSATGEMLRSLAKLENRKFIVNNDGFTIPHPEGDADTHPLGKAGIIQRPRHWKLGRSRLDQSPLSQEQLKVLHGFNPMYLSADVAVGDPEWRRLANIASSTYRPRTKGALDDRHYVQYGRMPSAEQDFSILRPDETGKGRGLGSVYPRVSTGRYGETNVEYDPSVRPMDASDVAKAIYYNTNSGRSVGVNIGTAHGRSVHQGLLQAKPEEDSATWLESVVNPSYRGFDRVLQRSRYDEFDPKSASPDVGSTKKLRRHLQSMNDNDSDGMSGLHRGLDPLALAGIRRLGRGPGRGGGPRFMAQHSFSIGASAPSATTLNHFHPSIRRSTKRRMFEVC